MPSVSQFDAPCGDTARVRATQGEIVEAMYRAFAAGDYAGALAYLSEDVHWDPGMPDLGARCGKREVVDLFVGWLGTWDDYRLELVEVVPGTDGVAVAFRQRGKGKGSGVELDELHVGVHRVRDGKVATLHRYATRDEALRAAGAERPDRGAK